MPCPFFMFWQLCVALCVAEGEGVAAVAADPLLAAVVPDDDDVEVVDAGVDELLVAALATAMLTPSPTPSAPAPTAAAMMILPRLDLTVPPPGGEVMVLDTGDPRWLRPRCSHTLPAV
jgi:hypothetical protein